MMKLLEIERENIRLIGYYTTDCHIHEWPSKMTTEFCAIGGAVM